MRDLQFSIKNLYSLAQLLCYILRNIWIFIQFCSEEEAFLLSFRDVQNFGYPSPPPGLPLNKSKFPIFLRFPLIRTKQNLKFSDPRRPFPPSRSPLSASMFLNS